MAFKMKGMPGIAGVRAEEDLKNELSGKSQKVMKVKPKNEFSTIASRKKIRDEGNKAQVGGRFKEIHDGEDEYPTFGKKKAEVEAHLKEFKAGGATDAEVVAERKRLMSAIMANIRK